MNHADVPGSTSVTTSPRLSPAEVGSVSAIVQAASEADGVPPLSEHVTLRLHHGAGPARHLLLWGGLPDDVRLVGYAHLDTSDPVAGPSAELVVAPEHRRMGFGRVLAQRLLAETTDGRLRLWAHGGHPAAVRLARSLGFRDVRTLWQMRRSLFAPLVDAPTPAGVTVRTFEPGRDEEPWVALNATAFATHPDQGVWTLDDLHRRMREPWFDPAGFFLAERAVDGRARLVGFHWTKIHNGGAHGPAPVGEVYVVGVDPGERGSGLGRALTVLGLRWLRAQGVAQAMLYVDATNLAAVRLYSGLGFTHWDTDVMFQRG